MKLVFHGGAREVGKSCIELVTEGFRYVLDAGLKFKEDGFEAPFQIFDMPGIDGLFLSHAHLDHTGALPLFEHYDLVCPIFTTEQTKELTDVMLRDSYKIARIKHLHPAYQKMDLKKVYKATRVVEFNKPYNHQKLFFKFMNAGHIPGSAFIVMRVEGKKIIYTGDFKLRTTMMMRGAEDNFSDPVLADELKNVDVLITESTYGNRALPDRSQIELDFLQKVDQAISKGPVVLPVFSIGRAQEILLILSKKRWPVPIYLDGMAVSITKKILSNDPANLNERKLLWEMFNRRIDVIKKDKKRHKVMNNRAIFVTTSGMLQGGPVIQYIENLWGNPDASIFLTGFQCKRTNGRMLLDEGFIYLNGWKTYVKCHVEKFDFSGHADAEELKELITRINPKNLIIQHGDEEASLALKEWVDKNTKIKSFVPAVGDSLEF